MNHTFAPARTLKRSTSVSQATLARLLQAAEQALNRGELKACLDICEQAGQLAPATPEILLLVGRAHGLRFDYAAAARCCEKAVQFSRHKTLTLSKAGAIAHAFYQQEPAERFLRRATEQKDATAKIWIQLAAFLEGARRVAESARCLEQAHRLDPSLPDIPVIRAQLERQANRWEEAKKLLRSLPPAINPVLRVLCLYELAAVLDRQGRYDEAMAALIEAKAYYQHEQKKAFKLKREALFRNIRPPGRLPRKNKFCRWAAQLQFNGSPTTGSLALPC